MFIDNLPPIIFLILLAFFVYSFTKSWFFPGALFPLFWAFSCMLPFTVPNLEVWSGALWWIAISCLAMSVGGLLGFQLGFPRQSKTKTSRDEIITFWKPVATLVGSFLAGFIYVIYVQIKGVNLSLADHQLPIYSKFLLAFMFCGPLIAGMIKASKVLPAGLGWLTITPIIPSAMLAILFTGRSQIFQPILYWVAGYFAYQVYLKHGQVALFKIRNIISVLIFVLVFVIIGMGLNMLRGFRSDIVSSEEKIQVFVAYASWDEFFLRWDRFRYLAFGNVAFFSKYFERAWDFPPPLHYGALIFAGPLKLLGIRDRTPFETQNIDDGVNPNVYTGFRPPIDDFGMAGSFLWWFLYGGVLGFSYVKVVHGRNPVYCVFLVSCYVDLALFGGSFFRYNSVILSYVISLSYLKWSTSQKNKEIYSSI